MTETPLNALEKMFVERWRSLDFTAWNESDVREGFITPLLHILGYAKDTMRDILREKTLTLSEAYHRIGRKRVDIDYVPTVRLRRYWVIEVKPGNTKQMKGSGERKRKEVGKEVGSKGSRVKPSFLGKGSRVKPSFLGSLIVV